MVRFVVTAVKSLYPLPPVEELLIALTGPFNILICSGFSFEAQYVAATVPVVTVTALLAVDKLPEASLILL
jgi:hypothetical protein